MRKWKCITVNDENRNNFTVGKIYETDDKMLNCKTDNGYVLTSIRIIEKGDTEMGLVFEEIKEEEKKVNKFKVGDVVRIIARESGHCFKIGDIVELYEKSSDGDFRGRQEGNSRDWGNWIGQEEMELIEENKASTKTITITTSDSTTTLTDGIITVSVNRYYTDKHDEEIAVKEVADKYYGELARIEREKSMPKVGDKVRVIDDERVYSRYDDWIVENKIDIKYALLWQENYSPKNESTGFIRAIYPHLASKDVILALVETESHAYIINIKGLEVVK